MEPYRAALLELTGARPELMCSSCCRLVSRPTCCGSGPIDIRFLYGRAPSRWSAYSQRPRFAESENRARPREAALASSDSKSGVPGDDDLAMLAETSTS